MGFYHHLKLETGEVKPGLEYDRPYVLNVSLDYCMTNEGPQGGEGPCAGENVYHNGDGRLNVGFILRKLPED